MSQVSISQVFVWEISGVVKAKKLCVPGKLQKDRVAVILVKPLHYGTVTPLFTYHCACCFKSFSRCNSGL